MNGDIGITLRDHNNNLRVVFWTNEGETGESLRWISPLRLPHVETAYAMTVHKSQGSEFSHVVLVLPEVQSRVLTRELIYTGITRAKENFTLVETGPKIFIQAIKTTCGF
jgi:exodeoxyribonuclease V alpha subunit